MKKYLCKICLWLIVSGLIAFVLDAAGIVVNHVIIPGKTGQTVIVHSDLSLMAKAGCVCFFGGLGGLLICSFWK